MLRAVDLRAAGAEFLRLALQARGQRFTAELLEAVGTAAAAQVEPTPDIRGSEWYKREMARVFTGRAIRAALARGNVAVEG